MNPPNVSFPGGGPSPIADLSYRNYDGVIRTRAFRWWIVALSVIRGVIRKPVFWILCALGLVPYLWNGAVQLYLSNQFGSAMGMDTDHATRYAMHFDAALEGQEFWIFLSALVVGSDCIAGDLRANALQIYLSKPITKGDYLAGKWAGVFLPLYIISAAPAAVLFICSALGMFGESVIKAEPTMLVRMIVATAIPAIVHTSLLIGFSAWSKSGRIAGAAYAGVCLVSSTMAFLIGAIVSRTHHGGTEQVGDHQASPTGYLIQHLSVSGGIKGLAQAVYHVKIPGSPFLGIPSHALPSAFPFEMFGLTAGLCVIGIVLARVRINAVEVVRG